MIDTTKLPPMGPTVAEVVASGTSIAAAIAASPVALVQNVRTGALLVLPRPHPSHDPSRN